MKIIAGKFKGRNFYMPHGIRPTQNILRKAFFDILGQDLEGMSFLDVFAGSGAMGLEAISRGSSRVVFVEKDPKCLSVLEENIQLLGIETLAGTGRYEILPLDGFSGIKALARGNQQFDIVFIDPPYDRGLAKKALKTLGGYGIVAANCVAAIQHSLKEILPEREGEFCRFREKKMGNSVLSFYKI